MRCSCLLVVLSALVSLCMGDSCNKVLCLEDIYKEVRKLSGAKGVSNADKKQILTSHNDFRKQIANKQVNDQPRGVNLKRLYWDDCLAKEAQRIANTCEFEHKKAVCSKWSAVGQNLYILRSTAKINGVNWKDCIEAWWDEHQNYKYGQGFSSDTGHYTQLVWANTDRVGCGLTQFYNNGWYQQLFVCNYGPAGNYVGQNPYQVGTKGCENLC